MSASILQETQTSGDATVTSESVTFVSAVTEGSTIHAITFAWPVPDTFSFSDNNSGSYTNLSQAVKPTGGGTMQDAYAPNHASGSTTVTASYSGGSEPEYTGIWIREIGGVTASPLNANAGEFSPDTPTITVSATASQPNTIWSALCLEADDIGTPTPTTGTQDALGWTFGGSQDAAVSSHLVSTASGSMSASFTLETSADDAYAVIAIFNATGAANVLVGPNGNPVISDGAPVIG